MVACSVPASTGSAAAADWAASRIRSQTGSTDLRCSAGLFATALSMALSSAPLSSPATQPDRSTRLPRRKDYADRPAGAIRGSASGPGLQLADQRRHLAAIV